MSQVRLHRVEGLAAHDGIEEYDNALPRWWLGIFFLCLIFGYGYWFYYHVAHAGPGQLGEYRAQKHAIEVARRPPPAPIDDAALTALMADPAAVADGVRIFTKNCVSCHGARAQGTIGPNLTDSFWLHGGRPVQIHQIVADGFLTKGMPTWKRVLGPRAVRRVTAYVLTLEGRDEPGKAPQGERKL